MDPRETERRVIESERLNQRELKMNARSGSRVPFWGRDHGERSYNIGYYIGAAVIFGYPAFLLLKGVLT